MKNSGILVLGSRTQLTVENIKCGGCANTITKELKNIGLQNISVDPEQCTVEMDTPENSNAVSSAIKKLRELGYPLIETEEGIKAALLKAKSYLSCAIGKIS